MGKNQKFWEIKAQKDTADIHIYGVITMSKWEDSDVTAAEFKKELDALEGVKTLNIYVNSPGGNVFQAQAIYALLSRFQAHKNVYVDGLAASAASFLIMAADKIYLSGNAMMMIHLASGGAYGNSKALRKMADLLDKVDENQVQAYMNRPELKVSEEALRAMLDAETWMDASECLKMGFCDEVLAERQVAACIDPELISGYKNVPENLIQALQQRSESPEQTEKRKQIAEKSKATLESVTQTLKF